MNTNTLKKFAQETRRKLMQQVAAKLEFVTNNDTPELREKAEQVRKLKEEIKAIGKEQVIEKVAYTWFNRFMALRFMDANDYQPLGVRVLSPLPGQTTPEILNQAKQADIPAELKLKPQKILDLLDGRTPSANPQNEAYKELLIASCNHLHAVLPFLFERINDYTELLLPDDLTSQFSIVYDVVQGMTEDGCQEVEIIGWLYQFYISEKKDEVFASKSKVKKEDIPAATQLFTPRWIVEYMVQNTVGKLWLQNKPNSKLREHMPYFIESPSLESEDFLKISSPEDIKLLDQACGSGHILVYGFDLLTKIYEEEGYSQSEIAQLILTKNLFGFEIDERAAQLAGMALLMKARSYQRRLFKKGDVPDPNILCYKDLTLSIGECAETLKRAQHEPSEDLLADLENMQQATNLGSLILPQASHEELQTALKKVSNSKIGADAFYQYQVEHLKTALAQLNLLADKYHCVVDNPPYMGGGNMNTALATYVKKNYPDSKADLMACFMEAGLKVLHPKGFLGMINQHSWMFLSSYETLRKKLIENTFFDTLLHLGPRTFPEIGGEVVQNAAFTFWNALSDEKGAYIRLVDFDKTEIKRDNTLEAIQNPDCGWFYTANQKDFEKIPGSPIGYWLSERSIANFDEKKIFDYAHSFQGLISGNNDKLMRYWAELPNSSRTSDFQSYKEALNKITWIPYQKGGAFRKWFGNNDYYLFWNGTGDNLTRARTENRDYYFKRCLSWTFLSSSKFGVRKVLGGQLWDVAGSSAFPFCEKDENIILGFLCCSVGKYYLDVLNPTLNFQVENILSLPINSNSFDSKIDEAVELLINLSRFEWNSRETSWDFLQNELIRQKSDSIEESFDLYQQYWRNKFFQLHKNEEELNRQFIEIYGLQEELAPDVPLEEITILKEETSIENGQLVFHADEVFKQFVSYAVGCMFGRYSLEKEGLVLANQGETLEDYWRIVDGKDGRWSMVDGGMVDGEDGGDNYKNDRYGKGLQGSENLAAEHGAGDFGVSGDEENAEGRTIQSDGPNKESGGERTEQHSRRTIEGEQRVSSLSQDSTRFISRIGNATSNSSESSDAQGGGYEKNNTGNNQHQKANSQPHGENVTTINHQPTTNNHFIPDSDNIIPILDEDWFEDDIVGRFNAFLKASFGAENFQKNAAFVEECLKKDLRKYFIKDFYNDHIKRYKKRPIYWIFSSPKGYFNVLIYMHRYTPDTLNNILNNYLREFIDKLKIRKEHLEQIKISGSAAEQSKAIKESDRINKMIIDCKDYEREILFNMATERISIDLDDGVLVNYNKFGKAIKEVKGLNDKKAKDKVKKFDWIDATEIR